MLLNIEISLANASIRYLAHFSKVVGYITIVKMGIGELKLQNSNLTLKFPHVMSACK